VNVDELIAELQALPAEARKLTVVSEEEAWLVDVGIPRIEFRMSDGLRDYEKKNGERVVVI
jgi:hypothetical protein